MADTLPANPCSNAARKRILDQIRRAQGRGRAASTADNDAIDTYLAAHPRGPLPEVAGDLVARFCAMAEASQSTTTSVASDADVPAAAARYLEGLNLPCSGCVWPALAHIDWASAGLALAARGANDEDAIGVTGAFAALAETGTLMVVSSPQTPATVSLLPETHIAIVPASRIVAHMEDAWDLARRELGQLPRAVNFISGPSRTADIEQQMVLGAHGPYRVHIIVYRD
ncbi:MAG: lactate utilization protein C [Betaproteobacteria bacterium]|nr:lactate utilization protein C [Betaproteobacteria bacterium]